MRLEINQFGGMAPIMDATALGERFATLAKNVRLDRGVLAPGALRLVSTSEYPDSSLSNRGIKSVAKLLESETRFAFSEKDSATAFVSPVSPADTWGRVYFTRPGGYPSFTTTDQYSPGGLVINPVAYDLGIPIANNRITLGLDANIEHKYEEGAPDEDGNVEQIEVEPDYVSVAYTYSVVDKYGHESSLAPYSEAQELPYDRPFSLYLQFPPYSAHNINLIEGVRRVYRATFDGSSSAPQFIMDVPINQGTTYDELPIGEEGEEAVSENWLPAPKDLQNLCLVASSYAAGFFDHYLCYSELKLPHAWPAELQYPIKYRPQKLVPMLGGVLVTTTGRPYWAEGADPYSAIPRELPVNAPCLSADSVVDMGSYAMYVSHEGLVAAGPSQAEIVTASIIDRGQMEALVDASCKAFAFEDRYIFSTTDGRWMGFVPQEGLVEYDFGFGPEQFGSVTFSVRDNRHYFAMLDGSIRVVDFEGEASDVEWHSKHWRTPPGSFSCLRVEADTYPVTVKVRCQYMSEPWRETPWFNIDDSHVQRLPVMTGGLWQVVVKPPNGGRVYRVILAQSGQEAA